MMNDHTDGTPTRSRASARLTALDVEGTAGELYIKKTSSA
jgi:hypothetical protein